MTQNQFQGSVLICHGARIVLNPQRLDGSKPAANWDNSRSGFQLIVNYDTASSCFVSTAGDNCGRIRVPGPMECGLTNPARAGRQQR
jgi:hypothetical protein